MIDDIISYRCLIIRLAEQKITIYIICMHVLGLTYVRGRCASMVILDPLKEYEEKYKREFQEKTSTLFEEIVKRSGIDEEQNRQTVDEYNKTIDGKASYEHKRTSLNIQKTIAIVLIVAGFVAAIVGILDLAGVVPLELGAVDGGIFIIVGLVVAIPLILVVCLYHNKKIHELDGIIADLMNKANDIKNKAYAEMAPLNALFGANMTAQLINSTIPMIHINRYMDGRFNEYLRKEYDYDEFRDPNRSIFDLVSGAYGSSPFVIERNISHEMSSKSYEGTLLITWTERYTDSDGHEHTRTRTQTLFATVVKPYPEYYNMTSTLFLSNACPNLSFSREPKLSGNESEKKLERIIRRGEKKIDRMSSKALSNDSAFAGLNNSEFDVLFDALDRDNEVEFNMLFSPAAQDNLTKLIKSKAPYGDDFHYHKKGKFNILMSDHMQQYDINFDETKYKSYDVRESRRVFNSYNNDFFTHFYFELAPILSIPLFAEYAHDEIELPTTARQCTSTREATTLANYMVNILKPNDADTHTILKLDFVSHEGVLDKYIVTAFAYRGEPRVDLVPRLGGDGRMHAVPVNWIEYIPTYSRSYFWVADLYQGMDEKDMCVREHTIDNDFGIDLSHAVINNGLLGFTTANNELSAQQILNFDKILNK